MSDQSATTARAPRPRGGRPQLLRSRRQVGLGPFRTVEFPSPELQPLVRSDYRRYVSPSSSSSAPSKPTNTSPHAHASYSDLRQRLKTHGYLFVPGLLSRSEVLEARSALVEHLASRGVLLRDDDDGGGGGGGDKPLDGESENDENDDTRMAAAAPGLVRMEGFGDVALHPAVRSLLECDELFAFFQDVVFGFGDDGASGNEPATTLDYKWIRAVGQHQSTGVHADAVYMSRGSADLHTVWIPLGDVPVEHGTLAVIDGSHALLDGYRPIRETYGRMDVDRDRTEGWLSTDPLAITEQYGSTWRTADFEAGDVLIFALQTLHASTTNLKRSYRLSCDVRFQPAQDPVDERWILPKDTNANEEEEEEEEDGSNDRSGGGNKGTGTGHTSHGKEELRSMVDARKEWGI
mmetsp:Transcript_31672/g.92891  ORF Transcript_31672/g.92891 Transcript_31672/m.92891 type:complete len:406 (+) Transcript_31672:121-1338(+)